MIIALDGPAGAGKSTVARRVARELGFTYLDTGAMYRCVALRAGDDPAPGDVALAVRIEFDGERVLADGEDVTDAIRTPETSDRASRVSADPAVRAALVEAQKHLMADGDWVAEGRDIGTVVAPHAQLKIFLTASPEERARRRAEQIGADLGTVLREQQERDARDEQREHSPLRAAEDALELDTTGLSQDEVVAKIVALAQDRRGATA